MELRRFVRYNLSTPLTGLVEHEDERYTGNVVNISVGGFFLHLPATPKNRLKAYCAGDYGELVYAGRKAHGFGQIQRIETYAQGTGVAFAWGADEMDKSGGTLIAEIIDEQIKMRQAGCVSTADSTIMLSGHVSSALATEIYAHLKTIGATNARLSLLNCTSIDSSGIQMLMTLRDMGALVTEAGENVKSVMLRFQLLPKAD